MNQEEILLSSLRGRYSPKSFDTEKKIPVATWRTLEAALALTPSSYGLQPWKFLVIRDAALREKLRAVSWNQRQVTECSHYLVFTHRIEMDEVYVDRYLRSMADARGLAPENLAGLRKGILGDVVHGARSQIIPEWAMRQVYIALGNFVTAASLLGVDACPMEGFQTDRYNEILGLLNTPYRATVACAAGYRNPTDPLAQQPKVRFPLSELITEL